MCVSCVIGKVDIIYVTNCLE